MTATETGAVADATVTVVVVTVQNSRGRQQSTTSGSIVAKTAAPVAMAAATVAMAVADKSGTGGQDVSVTVLQRPPRSSPPLSLS
jgi:hypothetical protein